MVSDGSWKVTSRDLNSRLIPYDLPVVNGRFRYVYWDLFAEVGYVRDRGFNVLHLDGHGGIIGAHNFFLVGL